MTRVLLWIGLAATVALAVYALDRLALWMEERGWLYYRKTKRRTGADLGNAFLEIQAMVDPGKKHVLEARREEKQEQSESGDPPESGDGSAP